MKHKLAHVSNIQRLKLAFDALQGRDLDLPGLGLVHGFTGSGKTTGIAWLANQTNGVFVRALATWTPFSMVEAIIFELGAAPYRRLAQNVNYIIQDLAQSNRPLFVDEADYLLPNLKMIETLRDIHDMAGIPVVIIGMEGLDKKIVRRQQFTRRISQWVEFLPLDLDDARILADTVCEVHIADDLLKFLHQQANGSIGLMVVGLARIEALAKAQGWDAVAAKSWARRPLFLGQPPNGKAPVRVTVGA